MCLCSIFSTPRTLRQNQVGLKSTSVHLYGVTEQIQTIRTDIGLFLQIYILSVCTHILPSFSNFDPLVFVALVRKPRCEAEGSARDADYVENEEELSEDEDELYEQEDEAVESGSVYDTTEQKLRLKQKQRKRIMERLNGNVQHMKIWHSCIMGEGGTYLLSMSDYSYEPWCKCYENTVGKKIILFFLF